jgi:hypothetical protein
MLRSSEAPGRAEAAGTDRRIASRPPVSRDRGPMSDLFGQGGDALSIHPRPVRANTDRHLDEARLAFAPRLTS